MNTVLLETIAHALVGRGKGILAADESTASANKRFAAVGVPETEEHRRRFRELLFSTETAATALSGVIFYDETFWQKNAAGATLSTYVAALGIIPGIKVDEGLVDLPGFPGEKITKGLDGLPERMIKYRDAGAKFAKWRAVITIGAETPTNEAIAANVFVLARYARICQDADIVPIVEPEVLFDGTHTAEQCEAVTVRVYDALISALRAYRVHLPGTILKTGMVLPGKDSGTPVVPKDVAERTVRVLHEHIPAELGGVVFLSGGQTSDQAFQNLNAIEQKGPHPWGVTFSYSRALQDPVLRYWAQHQDDPAGTQKLFASQLAVAVAARSGVLEMPASGGDFVSQSQDL
jgi:fructose-bisphosphate aldolase class I